MYISEHLFVDKYILYNESKQLPVCSRQVTTGTGVSTSSNISQGEDFFHGLFVLRHGGLVLALVLQARD